MKRKPLPLLLAVLMLALVPFETACAPNINMLKGDIDAFGPLIDYEISQGHISQALAGKYRGDAKLLIDDFAELAKNWSNKVLALATFAGQLLPIANDFAKIPHLQEAMLIISTTVGILRAYYGGSAPQLAPGAGSHPVPKNDGELNEFLKQQRAKLKAALAH